MQDTPTRGDDWDGLQSNTLLPRRFRSSACLRTPAVRVGLPTSHVGATAMHAARGAGQAFGQFQYLTSPLVEDEARVIRRVAEHLTEREHRAQVPPPPVAVGYDAADLFVLFGGLPQ